VCDVLNAALAVKAIDVGDHLVKAAHEQVPPVASIGAYHPERNALPSESLTHPHLRCTAHGAVRTRTVGRLD